MLVEKSEYEEQLSSELEQDAIRQEVNIDKVLGLQNEGLSDATKAGYQAIKDNFESICEGIQEYLQSRALNRGAKSKTYTALKSGRLKNLAYIIIQTTVGGVLARREKDKDEPKHISRTNLSIKIGKKIEREAKFVSEKNTSWTDWPKEQQGKCGQECLDIVQEKTALIEDCQLPPKNRKYKPTPAVKPTGYLLEYIEYFNQIFKPLYSPMVCKPKPWKGPKGGGYLSEDREIPIIRKSRYTDPDQLRDMTPEKMPLVFKVLNGIQSVPWKINKKMLGIMKKLLAEDPEIFKSDEDKKLNEAQVRLYLDEAERLAERDRFWLPANFDFRGRVYYLPFLNPQGPDFVRALLDFADSAVSKSNFAFFSYGRTLYAGRTDYVERAAWPHHDNIQNAALKPLENKWWRGAKDKWQFLRWCLEYVYTFSFPKFPDSSITKAVNNVRASSSMPIYVDASCNAIQHIAALLRDKRLAESVNMCEPPLQGKEQQKQVRDIYDDITKAVNNELKKWSRKKDRSGEFAKAWLRLGIGRDGVKETVMTIPYGRTEWANRNSLLEKYGGRLEVEDKREAANWFNNILWGTVNSEIPQIKWVKNWLGVVAKKYNSSNKHVQWKTPSGFIVRQRYFREKSKKVELPKCKNKKRFFRIREKTNAVNNNKSQDGITANFIHSLDAAALILTIRRAMDGGKKNFAVIHDCFGAPHGDIDAIARCARAGLIQAHDGYPLSEYHKSFCNGLPEKTLPDPPSMGSFDINDVWGASYAFS